MWERHPDGSCGKKHAQGDGGPGIPIQFFHSARGCAGFDCEDP